MEIVSSESHSFIKLLKVNREHLVTHIRNTQCLLDNLLQNDYFSTEDAEIVCACPTQPDKVRRILDLVQSKGEEVSEFFLYVLQQLADAYVDLRPWLSEIGFSPSPLIQSKAVVNTDPGTREPPRRQGPQGFEMLSVRAQQGIKVGSILASPAFHPRQQALLLCSF